MNLWGQFFSSRRPILIEIYFIYITPLKLLVIGKNLMTSFVGKKGLYLLYTIEEKVGHWLNTIFGHLARL